MNRYRLKNIDIEGFRIYSERKSISFYNNLTVIYGRNGRGKTTLQDAISWLFNNDLVRYSMYNREWSRVKKTHTRSLIHPEKSTSITGCFQNVSTSKIEQITRNESNFKCPESLAVWFKNNQRDDLLWANSLSQSKLQELAVAKGRERLENLAPLLDLTKVNKQVKDIEEQIKDKKYILKDKKIIIGKLNNKNYSEMLSKVRESGNLLNRTVSTIILIEDSLPRETNEVYEEIKEWRKWLEKTLKNIFDKQSVIQRKITNIRERYFDVEPLINGDKIETVEELESKLKIISIEQKEKEEKIKKLEYKRDLLKRDNIEINNLFSNLKKLRNSKEQYLYKKNQLKGTLLESEERSKELEVIQNEVNLKSQKFKKLMQKYKDLLKEKNLIEDKYKEFLSLQGHINNKVETIKIDKEWLKENSPESNNQLLESLERKLIEIGGSTEILAKQKIDLEDSFSVLTNYITSQYCPFCGVEHKSTEKLESAKSVKKEHWMRQLYNLGEEIEDVTNEIAEFRKFNFKKESKERSINYNRKDIKKSELKIDDIKKDLEEVIYVYKLNNNSTLNISESTFVDLLDKNQIKIEQVDNQKTSYNNELLKNEDLMRDIESEVQENKKIYNENNDHINNIEKRIESLEKNIYLILDKYEYTSLNELNEELVLDIISNQSLIVNQNLIRKNSEFKEMNFEKIERKLYVQYGKQDTTLEEATLEINYLFDHLDILDYNLQELQNKTVLEKELQILNNEIRDLKVERTKVREIQRIETNKEIGKMSRRISSIFEILSDVSPWKTIKPDAVVPDEKERTNLIFRPIPHNIKNGLQEYISKTNSNSTFAFSGGQLSLLGLSIFLSQVADEEKKAGYNNPFLDTLFLDDPIQMLDTLRDDALVSLLCDISRDRQVIISTSDIDFANKLILSSRPMWHNKSNSCGVIYFQQLQESGPVVSQLEPHDWVSSQRIYLPNIKQVK
ncbi:hypothetical protein CR203_24035 [Salipaludibacillus neizhouensis]|uniref:Nuclease SbcCD subunit C n=1 Tax=Salipaludibacillus neizhouensis TaxID=885475 RepID=A0A3A9K3K8_9BACI|nr:AAA family ATPase [Salipaludibacillus neizhouensis]RKL64861.1 hypothetical protein CR203_24035 [Salipaludibacillus neizhouensis]